MITQTINLNIIPESSPIVIHVDQYDEGTGRLIFNLYQNSVPYAPAGATAIIQGVKPDRKGFDYPCSIVGNVVTADLTKQMTAVGGAVRAQIVVTDSDGRSGSFAFILDVQHSALPEDTDISDSDYQIIEQAVEDAQDAAQTAIDIAATIGSLDSLTDVTITTPSSGQVLKYNGSIWVNGTGGGAGASTLDELDDVTISTPTNGQGLIYNSTSQEWENANLPSGGASDLDDLDDVTISTPTNGQGLLYNSTSQKWENTNIPSGGASDLDDLTDVTISSPTSGQYLKYNGAQWVNAAGGGGGADELNDLSDVTLSTPTSGQVLTYDGSKWENQTPASVIDELSDLNDVTVSSPTNGQGLLYNSTSQKWENTNIPSGGASDLTDLGDVAVSSPTNNQVLTYDSVAQKWKNANAQGGGGDYVGLYGMTEIQSSDGQGTTTIDLDTYTTVGNFYCEGKGQAILSMFNTVGNTTYGNRTIPSAYFLFYVRRISTNMLLQDIYVYSGNWATPYVEKYSRTATYDNGAWTFEKWRLKIETGVNNGSNTGIRLDRSLMDVTIVTASAKDVLMYESGRWKNKPVFQPATLAVDLTGWTTDTTSQSGTTLYKKQITLTNVYVESPSVDIGAGTGYVLPTSAEQESYNLIQYVTVDDTVPCLYLYASEIPTTAFYIKVTGVD